MAKILCEVRYNNYNTATNSTCFRAFFTKKLSKIVALLLAGALTMLLFTACGGGGGSSTDEQKEAAMLTALTSSPQCSETAKTNDPELRNMLLTDLNAQLKTGRFKSDVKVKGIRPDPEENITITVMTEYRYGERLQDLIEKITNHIGSTYPGTNVDVNANGCWTKVAVVVQSNEKGTYLAVAIQLKNLAYPQN